MTETQIIETIKKKRKEKRLTQTALAEILGIKRQYISVIEQGRRVPTIKTLVRICDALEIEVKVE